MHVATNVLIILSFVKTANHSDDDSIIWTNGASEDYKFFRDEYKYKRPQIYDNNNVITIATNIEQLKPILKKKGITRIKRWKDRCARKYGE